jgi:hypothetical protein
MIGKALSLEDWRLIVVALAVAPKSKGLTLSDDQKARCKEMARELAAETGKYEKP